MMRLDAPALLERNRAAHRMLLAGVTAEYRRPDGSISGELPIEDAERFIEGVK